MKGYTAYVQPDTKCKNAKCRDLNDNFDDVKKFPGVWAAAKFRE